MLLLCAKLEKTGGDAKQVAAAVTTSPAVDRLVGQQAKTTARQVQEPLRLWEHEEGARKATNNNRKSDQVVETQSS